MSSTSRATCFLASLICFWLYSGPLPAQDRALSDLIFAELKDAPNQAEAHDLLSKHFPEHTVLDSDLDSQHIPALISKLNELPPHALLALLKTTHSQHLTSKVMSQLPAGLLSEEAARSWFLLLIEADLYKATHTLLFPSQDELEMIFASYPRQNRIYQINAIESALTRLGNSKIPISSQLADQIVATVRNVFRGRHIDVDAEWTYFYHLANAALELFFKAGLTGHLSETPITPKLTPVLMHLISEFARLRKIVAHRRLNDMIALSFYVLERKAADIALRLELPKNTITQLIKASDLTPEDWRETDEFLRAVSSAEPVSNTSDAIARFSVEVTAQKHSPQQRENATITYSSNGTALKLELPLSLINRLGATPEQVEKAVHSGRFDELIGPGFWVVFPNLDQRIARFFSIAAPLPTVTAETGPMEIYNGYQPHLRERISVVDPVYRSSLKPETTFWTLFEPQITARLGEPSHASGLRSARSTRSAAATTCSKSLETLGRTPF